MKRKKKPLHFAESYIPKSKNRILFHIFDRVLNGGKVFAFTGLDCGNDPRKRAVKRKEKSGRGFVKSCDRRLTIVGKGL